MNKKNKKLLKTYKENIKKTKDEKNLDFLKLQRKLAREEDIKNGVKHRPTVHKNKKAYDRKKLKKIKDE